MMRQAGLTGARCLPMAWVDAEYAGYMRHALKSRAGFAAQHGAVPEAEAKAITYYGFVGTR